MRDSCCPCLGNVLACFCGCEDMIVNSFAHFSPCVVFFFFVCFCETSLICFAVVVVVVIVSFVFGRRKENILEKRLREVERRRKETGYVCVLCLYGVCCVCLCFCMSVCVHVSTCYACDFCEQAYCF